MSNKFSTYKSISSSPAPAPPCASKASPNTDRATASATAGNSCSSAAAASPPCTLMSVCSASATDAAIFGPASFFFRPSRMAEDAMVLQWACTSPGSDEKAACDPKWSFASLPCPLVCRANSALDASPKALPATISAAALPGTRSEGGANLKRSAGAGSSPVGASISPAFTSSSITLAACFCAPNPSSPARMRSSILSMLGEIVFWSFGAPPAFFQAPFA
mmetsp:Transcript_109466/g.274182  ORF Transcript_109466/g.274182 Transcript_109466/m.274182 type:complete len:220 (+) Transcript_109466:2047-2706(+)